MKGSKCRCGFATLSDRRLCPRCERRMKLEEWADEGRVLSFTRLQTVPEGLQEPHDMVLVQVEKGPKLVCGTTRALKENDEVRITEADGKYMCEPRAGPELEPEDDSEPY